MFGRGREGQLGRADHIECGAANRSEPVAVDNLTHLGYSVLGCDCGAEHTVAVVCKD